MDLRSVGRAIPRSFGIACSVKRPGNRPVLPQYPFHVDLQRAGQQDKFQRMMVPLGLRKSFTTQAAGISADDLLSIEYSPKEGRASKNADMCRANLPKCSRPVSEAISRQ
jgi:hypothetical protein